MYEQAYEHGRTFAQFLESAQANAALWEAMALRAPEHAAVAAEMRAIEGSWRFLVLADDWCGDAVNTLPTVARLAAAAEIPLRIVARDAYPEIMDRHLTGSARSIPVVLLLAEDGTVRSWWGPRPTPLQMWFEAQGRQLPKEDRYLEMRRWYARDRGATTAHEIVELLRCAANGEWYEGTTSCREREAA